MANYDVKGYIKGGNNYLFKDAKARDDIDDIQDDIGDLSTTQVAGNSVAGQITTLNSNIGNLSGTGVTGNNVAAQITALNGKIPTTAQINAWNNKQDKLTFDTNPSYNSLNPVTSDGIYKYAVKRGYPYHYLADSSTSFSHDMTDALEDLTDGYSGGIQDVLFNGLFYDNGSNRGEGNYLIMSDQNDYPHGIVTTKKGIYHIDFDEEILSLTEDPDDGYPSPWMLQHCHVNFVGPIYHHKVYIYFNNNGSGQYAYFSFESEDKTPIKSFTDIENLIDTYMSKHQYTVEEPQDEYMRSLGIPLEGYSSLIGRNAPYDVPVLSKHYKSSSYPQYGLLNLIYRQEDDEWQIFPPASYSSWQDTFPNARIVDYVNCLL